MDTIVETKDESRKLQLPTTIIQKDTGGRLEKDKKFQLTDFDLKKEAGKGTFGTVLMAEYQDYRYAIKTVNKEFIVSVSSLICLTSLLDWKIGSYL
jgi:hypothetical protein